MIPPELKPLAELLWKSGAINLDGAFTLKSHKEPFSLGQSLIFALCKILSFLGLMSNKIHKKPPSTVYVNLRDLACTLKGCTHLETVFNRILFDLEGDYIAGVPEAVIPVAAYLMRSDRPMLIARLKKKKWGIETNISGKFQSGQTVIVIDDVITTGSSILATIKILEAAGLIVKYVVVLVDRQQGGVEQLSQEGYELRSVFTLPDLLKHCLTEGWIDENTYRRALDSIDA